MLEPHSIIVAARHGYCRCYRHGYAALNLGGCLLDKDTQKTLAKEIARAHTKERQRLQGLGCLAVLVAIIGAAVIKLAMG